MKGVPNFHHCYTFVLLFFVLVLFPAFSVSTNTLSARESLTISSNNTIVSPSHIFELGFFKLPSNSGWYIGIWYKVISKRTYVRVANRDSPLSNPMGTLKISDNNLVIFDVSNTTPVWSTNLTRGDVKSPLIAELLDNGNFVLRDSNNNNNKLDGILWQSFDFPTDTLLPEMKLGWDRKTGFNRLLRSWRSTDDPSSGDFSFKMETRGFPQIFLWKNDSRVYRNHPWNGVRFTDTPKMQPFNDLVLNFRVTDEEFWHAPKDQCDQYKVCGSYGYCDSNKKSPFCQCIKGFELEPIYPMVWGLGNRSGACARKTQLRCDGRDGFVQLKNVKLPDSMEASVDRGIGVKECEDCKSKNKRL
ncbi:Receptor-like serine/threonine-protein kinase SD1-8 [Raphanus sativus]|nr:Receptor-like serine/threonine-protein kinase SD1-8 [Raphanus sativus]